MSKSSIRLAGLHSLLRNRSQETSLSLTYVFSPEEDNFPVDLNPQD